MYRTCTGNPDFCITPNFTDIFPCVNEPVSLITSIRSSGTCIGWYFIVTNICFVDSLDIYYTGFTFDGYYEAVQQISTTAGDTDIEYAGTVSNTLYIGLNKIANTGFSLSATYNRQDIKTDAGNFSSVLGTNEIKGNETGDNYLFNSNYEFKFRNYELKLRIKLYVCQEKRTCTHFPILGNSNMK